MGDLQQASPIPANVPKGLVTEWNVEDVRNWLSQSMQLPQYLEQFEGIFFPSGTSVSVILSGNPRVVGLLECRSGGLVLIVCV
jgi:hypothetical protein